MLELSRKKVRIIGGNAGFSEKNNIEYAILEYKTEKGFKGIEYIAPATPEIQDLVKGLDKNMGQEITLITSIEE